MPAYIHEIRHQDIRDCGKEIFKILEVFNLLGQRIALLAEGTYDEGTYFVYWDGTDSDDNQVVSGVYFYRLMTDEYKETKKMVLIK